MWLGKKYKCITHANAFFSRWRLYIWSFLEFLEAIHFSHCVWQRKVCNNGHLEQVRWGKQCVTLFSCVSASSLVYFGCLQSDGQNIAAVCYLYSNNKQKEACSRCCCHCVCSSDVQLFHSTNLHPIIITHTHACMHAHTHKCSHTHTVYYHLSLFDSTEQQELYTLINQPTCQCIYNHY